MSLDVQGFEEISRALIDMSNQVNRQTQDRALEAGAEILEAEIKSEANRIRDDGTLYDNIKTTEVKNSRITVHTGGAYHAHLIEFGRSAGQGTYVDKNGVTRPVKWGTTTPQPVVQGSYERKKGEILREMVRILREDLRL